MHTWREYVCLNGAYGGGTSVYRCLSEDSRCLIVKSVMNGVERKGTAKILICFNE